MPYFISNKNRFEKIDQTSISKHYFRSWAGNDHFALGLITMLNHSKTPNVEVFLQKTPQGYIAICQSLADIKIKNQLFMDYGDGAVGF
jgi:SET domain-containing protein